MAALTQSAIEGLLGLLSTAIKDEAGLIGGVPGDMKFIKDEMDSMNGFLMHLNKMESEHDDLIRSWMKQVREVAYVAEDCVERYVHDVARHGHGVDRGGFAGYVAMARLILLHPRAYCQLRKLGQQITELKARVHEVGERRKRYDVSVPAGRERVLTKPPGQEKAEERREAFVHALEQELEKDVVGKPAWWRAQHAPLGSNLRRKMGELLQDTLPFPSSWSFGIIGQLPAGLVVRSEAATVRGILKKCCPPDHPGADAAEPEAEAFRCTKKMFLCALYVYPYPTSQELKKLEERLEVAGGVGAQEARNQVMVFCYSMLSTQEKSCLQYLTAFLYEKEISRTSMVRRWVAEGLVGKEPGGGGGGGGGGGRTTPEEAGERCFSELLLRGFIRPARRSDAGTVKSCVMDAPARDFILGITKNENFVADLPAHLDRQLKIRSIVNRRPLSMPPPPAADRWRNMLLVRRRHCCNLLCCGGGTGTCLVDGNDAPEDEDDTTKDPMDALVDFIRALPELYRLNVLDLGGCRGLRSRHLKSFGKVDCLRYLSLRNTYVSRLHAHHINSLTMLETLDIRGTNIPPRDTKRIYLPKLKHLLAGRYATMPVPASGSADAASWTPPSEKALLVTVHMPDRIGSMRLMETLSQVQVSMDGAELQGVAKLQQLRKLGVVVHGNATTAALLGRVLYVLAGCLRSLSIRVAVAVVVHTTTTTTTTTTQQGGGTGGILDISSTHEIASTLVLENLDIKGKMSLPSWIGRAPKLANVTLRDTEMDAGDALRRLATILSLRCLKLSRKAFTDQALRFKDVQFQALRFLVVEGDAVTRVTFFAADAAPKLEKIVWAIGGGSSIAQTMHNEELIVGIDHLPSLKQIVLRACFKLTNLSEWTKQQATSANPSYRIRYISSSDGQLITELPRTATHTTLSLPAGVIN